MCCDGVSWNIGMNCKDTSLLESERIFLCSVLIPRNPLKIIMATVLLLPMAFRFQHRVRLRRQTQNIKARCTMAGVVKQNGLGIAAQDFPRQK